ncbi:MAG: hypothetical protein MI807_16170 [Verrucomicrobiales bacterium]|nr:hypothetical protein [Verrucomicrobiales bacterium]
MKLRAIPVLLLIACFGEHISAHEFLYNFLEVKIGDDEGVTVHFTVHAAEFSDDSTVDPTSTDTTWFETLPFSAKTRLCGRADSEINKSYRIQSGESRLQPLPIPVEAGLDNDTRPGCLSTYLSVPDSAKSITLFYSGVGKRLLLVITRKGSFPKTHDLASGDSCKIPLHP